MKVLIALKENELRFKFKSIWIDRIDMDGITGEIVDFSRSRCLSNGLRVL